jgi:hypothetical protein
MSFATFFGKSSFGIVGFCFLLAQLAASANAAIVKGPIVDPANGHTYYLLSPSTWISAQSQAVAMGGNLATVRNVNEQNFIFNTFGTVSGTNYSLWIGLYDPTGVAHDDAGSLHASHFVWVDGEPVTYTDWLIINGPQPDDFSNQQYYTHMMNTGNDFGVPAAQWDDMDNTGSGFPTFAPCAGVVEVAPEPASLGFLGVGVTALLIRRAKQPVRK